MNPSRYVGIDVAKESFEVATDRDQETSHFAYTAAGIRKLLARLAAMTVALICLEATGGYERRLALALAENGYKVAIVNPTRTRRFADASGNLAKTDRLDAISIARFARVMNPPPWQRPDPTQAEVRELATRRLQLIGQRSREKNRRDKAVSPVATRQIRSSIAWFDRQVQGLEEAIGELIAKSPDLKARYDLMLTVPGVGPVLPSSAIAYLPELGTLNRRELAALVGVGRPKKVALIACARKLLLTLNAVVRQDRAWTQPR